jgi:hypothetical protein
MWRMETGLDNTGKVNRPQDKEKCVHFKLRCNLAIENGIPKIQSVLMVFNSYLTGQNLSLQN